MRAAAALGATAPLPVICMVEHLHKDRSLADDVCEGRFTHAGITLSLGLDPDWRSAGPAHDVEWRIEWSKFYYGLDLAHAFRESGDARYLRTWERLVRSWIRQVPVDRDPADVTGRRIQNWVHAWSLFAGARGFPGLAAGQADAILASIHDQVAHLRGHLAAERNHRTLELYALFVVGLALPDLDPGGALLDFAILELHRNLLADVLPDGVHRERSTHYHMVALRSFLGARLNAEHFGLAMPAGYDERLEKACEFALHCHRPDGQIPALSDGDSGGYLDLLAHASRALGRPDFLYAATRGAQGSAPAQTGAHFPDGGYFFQRSGWGGAGTPFADERFLVFDCGPIGDGGHGHYDLLSVEVAAGGGPLLVDPGRYSYSEHPPNWRRWFKGTAAHNTVCVDGLDQTPYACGKPRGPVAEGRLLERISGPGLDLLHGVARSPAYDAVHARRVLFAFDEYWILEDRLRGTRARLYDLRFHLAPDAEETVSLADSDGATVVRAHGLTLVIRPGGRSRLESGWVAPRYGHKRRASIVSVTVGDVADADFLTLILPSPDGLPSPSLRVAEATGTAGDGVTLEITGLGPGGRMRDRLFWAGAATPFALGPFSGRAVLAALRETLDGEPLRFAASGERGEWLSWDAASGWREAGS